MSQAKMTPGPWRVIKDSLDVIGNNPQHRRFIAQALESNDADDLPSVHTDMEAFANARAIAKLPELIEAAQRLANSYEKVADKQSADYGDLVSMRRVLAAIDGEEE